MVIILLRYLVGLVSHDNPAPNLTHKRCLVLDQHRVGTSLRPIFLDKGRFIGGQNTKNWFEIRPWPCLGGKGVCPISSQTGLQTTNNLQLNIMFNATHTLKTKTGWTRFLTLMYTFCHCLPFKQGTAGKDTCWFFLILLCIYLLRILI